VKDDNVCNGSTTRIWVVNFSSDIGGKPDLSSCRIGPLLPFGDCGVSGVKFPEAAIQSG